ncbi:phytanoyl-CoA dioxygenase family protein [Streptomyces sp. NBC_01451]|uniref:phytanoyl-CoA dioxygenase family protein n=1 Tax=Streptomyces sp. NBC_01451 TaxID=2903872 RepID=UPI002E348AFD|nr:phytanoyl-CoA dioxygenase family protein [Streptomyces sp. NBC_01451]
MTPNLTLPVERTLRLSDEQIDRFARLGYLVLPGFLPDELAARLRREADRWVDEGLREKSIASCVDPDTHGLPPVMELELAAHGELVGHEPLLDVLSQVMGPDFVFHHLHSDRQRPDVPGKPWHHDYEQRPQTDRNHAMIHTLHYLDGLGPDTSALVVLPGSHLEVAGKDARGHLGTAELPGEAVIDHLPPGSTVVLHSALFHARRPARGGLSGRDRYFVDASYCQVGTAWPPVKPYWRHMLRRARALGLDRGRPELFAERHFTEYTGPA